jgi:GrpB-like predicted nucleotidyltransferase (UPF0157 family)
MSAGLAISAVVIVPYRETWPTEFAALAARLRATLGARALRIEHIGPTAIAGLPAKDVIDVQVSVAALDDRVGDSPAAIGLRRDRTISADHVAPGATSSADEWRKLFFVEAPGERRSNIHVRETGRLNERYALPCRDYLRAHPRAAAAYGELKRRLSVSLASPDDYADVKDPAVDVIFVAAEAWATATRWTMG